MSIADADLAPPSANLAEVYASFADVAADREQGCARVNARAPRETALPRATGWPPAGRLHLLPVEVHSAALGEGRRVDDAQAIRFGALLAAVWSVRTRVWCRVVADELAIVGATDAGLAEMARHRQAIPGVRRSSTPTTRPSRRAPRSAEPGRGGLPRGQLGRARPAG